MGAVGNNLSIQRQGLWNWFWNMIEKSDMFITNPIAIKMFVKTICSYIFIYRENIGRK